MGDVSLEKTFFNQILKNFFHNLYIFVLNIINKWGAQTLFLPPWTCPLRKYSGSIRVKMEINVCLKTNLYVIVFYFRSKFMSLLCEKIFKKFFDTNISNLKGYFKQIFKYQFWYLITIPTDKYLRYH